METYTYVNIFETQGLEYLLLLSFLLLLMLVFNAPLLTAPMSFCCYSILRLFQINECCV